MDPARPANRLANETSPYLLQHAHNPVDWYPWGEEALERARREDRPIFLSIGYAACHWCHVMERESFEDPATARLLNDGFVCIKVDREERPDLDEIYMTATQILTGSGGWPMSVFLTPGLEPFFAGTYFPPEDRWGHPGFPSVLRAVLDAYRGRRAEIDASAGEIAEAVRRATATSASRGRAGAPLLDAAAADLAARFDPANGGFGGAPKFPPHLALDLLLRQFGRTGDAAWLEIVSVTLERMASGGIHDQIGGGFHRYAVDARWEIPHFEKMLYDNALLAPVYLDAARATGRTEFLETARDTLDFVLRELADPAGGFYSSIDADSEGEEGRFYVWTPRQVEEALGAEEAPLFNAAYGVTEDGNFEQGRSVLRRRPLAAAASGAGGDARRGFDRLPAMRARLLEARAGRVRPAVDDKVLAGWNGLMIAALAHGYEVTREERYRTAAERAADFVLGSMMRKGRLARSWRNGRAAGSAFLEDYAFVAQALIALFRISGNVRRLQDAKELARTMVELFEDANGGGLFFTPSGHEALPARPKSLHDGAIPSGNSAALRVLLELGRLLDDAALTARAREVLDAHAGMIERAPAAFAGLLAALDFALAPPKEIVIVGPRERADTRALDAVASRRYLPNVLFVDVDAKTHQARPNPALLAGKGMVDGAAAAYVCANGSCRAPVTSAKELATLMESMGPRPE